MIYCSKCGGTLDTTGLCFDCGAKTFSSAPVTQPAPPHFDVGPDRFPVVPAPKRSSFPRGLIVVLLAVVCIPAIALLIYFAVSSGSRNGRGGTPSPFGTPTPTVNVTTSSPVPTLNPISSNSPPTHVPTAVPTPSLSDSFQHSYQGHMGKEFSLTATLSRSGDSLSGRASTSGRLGSSWDRLEGTIDSNGHFTLVGYERGGSNITGDYEGWVRGRSVSGNYTSRLNNKAAKFHLDQQD
jgi:hypothetical protein